MSTTEKVLQRAAGTAPLALSPLNATSLRDQAYALLKTAIADTDIYNPTRSCGWTSGSSPQLSA